MSGYILAVAGAVLLSALVTVLLPSGKMGSFLKGMSRLAVFAVLLAPLAGLLSKREPFFSQSGIEEDEEYLAACARLLSDRDEEEIAALLERDFLPADSVEVERRAEAGFPLSKITVNLSADGINGADGHIHMADRIRAALAEKYGCEEQAVEVVWDSA